MVGCSVPYCSNRTDKGFKTYRLPHEPRRRQLWIRFAGRNNWNPGSGASFCQVHFEESAFESHRADGLRKLKPNAVPTIHSSSTSSRKQRKQNVKPRVEFMFGDSSSDSLVLVEKLESKPNEGNPLQIAEVYCSQIDDPQSQSSGSKNLKTIHVSKIVNKRVQAEVKGLPLNKAKRGRPLKKRKRSCNMGKCKINDSSLDIASHSCRSENEMIKMICHPDSSEPEFEKLTGECFVCNHAITPGCAVCLNTPAEATRVLLAKRLEMIADLDGIIDPEGEVCMRCASLLNHIDRTEAELAILKSAISACSRGRNLDGRIESDAEFNNNVQLLNRFEGIIGEIIELKIGWQ